MTYHIQGKGDDAKQAYNEAARVNREFAGMFDFLTRKEAPTRAAAPSAIDPLQAMAAQKAYDDGAAYLRLGAHDKALDAFDRSLSMNPGNADAHNGKGIVLIHQRQYAQAIALFQRALQLDPGRGGYHINLAITHHLQGKREEALREYHRAVELDASYRDQLDIFEAP